MYPEASRNKPKIDYPCEWNYRIIGSDLNNLLRAIEEAAAGLIYDVTPSNISKKGNYFSLNLNVEVPNEVVRDIVYEKLQKHPSIKYIL